jgi:hypothetical protein
MNILPDSRNPPPRRNKKKKNLYVFTRRCAPESAAMYHEQKVLNDWSLCKVIKLARSMRRLPQEGTTLSCEV